MLTLNEISSVLGCSKAAASMVRAGQYERPASPLPAQYAALAEVVARAEARGREAGAGNICFACPREDCAGCRVAELTV